MLSLKVLNKIPLRVSRYVPSIGGNVPFLLVFDAVPQFQPIHIYSYVHRPCLVFLYSFFKCLYTCVFLYLMHM